MKKFLSMLLALSVVFTYTFGAAGSVFAATVSADKTEYDLLVEQAAAQVENVATTNYSEAVKLIADTDITDVADDIDADLWKASAPIYQAKIAKMVDKREAEIKALYNSEKATVETWTLTNVVGAFAIAKNDTLAGSTSANTEAIPASIADMGTAIVADDDVVLATAKAYLTGVADDAIVTIKAINTGIYSDTVNTTTKLSSAEMAELVKSEAVAAIQKLNIAGLDTLAALQTATTDLGAYKTAAYTAATDTIGASSGGSKILGAFVKATDATYGTVVYAIDEATQYKSQSLVTKDDESDATKTLEATKASYIAKVNSEYANLIKTATTDAAKEEAEAYKAGVTEIINSAEKITDLTGMFANEDAIAAQKPLATGTYYAADAKAIAALEVIANKYIAEGYDATAINKIVAGAKVQAYKLAAAWNETNDAEEAIKAAVVAQFDTAKVDAEVAKAEVALDAIVDAETFYAPELAKVQELYNGIIAELKQCITDKELQTVATKYSVGTIGSTNYNNPKGLSDITNKEEVKRAIKKTTTEWNTNVATVKGYATFLNSALDSTKDGYRDFVGAGWNTSDDDEFAATLADFYGEAGARTTAEATAMIAQAKAALEAVKTNGEVKAAAKAIEDQIASLPEATAITANDAAAVKAAKEAYDDFKDATGSDISATAKTKLNAVLKAAALAEKLVIEKEINAYAVKTVTAADEDAIKALLEKADAFNDEVAANGAYYGTTVSAVTVTSLQGYLKTIRTEAKEAVEKAIKALPITITADNYAKVDEAKAAYDAYVAKYTDYKSTLTDIYGTNTFNANAATDLAGVKADLDAAVKAAAEVKAEIAAKEEADKKAEEEKAVLETKLAVKETTARFASSKAYKNSIKLTFKKPAVGVDGYKVYMATKKNGLYKLVGTTTTNTFTKKNLKKGTSYYFKVKAYKVVGEEKVYTQTSGKYCKKTTK